MRKLLKTLNPPQDNRTFTVEWIPNINQDPALRDFVWSDDAVGIPAGSDEFDRFFGIRPVLVDATTTEVICELKKDDFTKYVNGESVSYDNADVMIEIPLLGVFMEKEEDTNRIKLSITRNPNREADGFQYYAHSLGNIDVPKKKNKLYLGVYKAGLDGDRISSLPNKTPMNVKMSEYLNYISQRPQGYMLRTFYQHMLICAMYMMKYGNVNCQATIGKGRVNGSQADTGGTETIGMTGAINKTDGATGRIKLFGLEDIWGNAHEFVAGYRTTNNLEYFVSLEGYTADPTEQRGQYIGAMLQTDNPTKASSVIDIKGDRRSMFLAESIDQHLKYNEWYGSRHQYLRGRFGYVGGNYTAGNSGSLFRMYMGGEKNASSGARLALLK